jgi:hypothetical protein
MMLPLLVAPCLAQYPTDTRPFGKYLLEVCTLSGEDRTLSCIPTPLSNAGSSTPDIPATRQSDQAVTLKLTCDPAAKGDCNPQYPLIAGADFFIAGTADSGQTVRQRVLSGSATPVDGTGTVHYRANAPGFIVVRGKAEGNARFRGSAPVDLILQVISDPSKAGPVCAVLPPAAPPQSTPLDAPTIVSLMGTPTPFVLAAQGPNTIAVYTTRLGLVGNEPALLNSFQASIATLAGRSVASLGITPPPAQPFTVELTIPHASALGDLAARIGTLNFSKFTVQDVGSDKVRVTVPTTPDCDTWKSFLSDIRRMEWSLISTPMTSKLFYLSASDVATAFNFSNASAASTTPAASTPASTPAATAPTTPSAGTNLSVTQPPGTTLQISSDTTPCVVAGLSFGNPNACGPAAAAPAAASPSATPPAAAAPVATSVTSAPLSMGFVNVATAAGATQTPPDLLVYSDTNPGDDAQIMERNRVIAQLDLPRPEMIVNAWVMQNSSSSPQAMGAFSNMVKGLVAQYDSEFEQLVLRGWTSVKEQSNEPNFFYEPFRSYIADRFIADTFQEAKPGKSAQEMSQAFLDNSQAKLADPIAPLKRTDLGICERGRYCLGYNDLFKPLKPSLTDLLLTIIAANDPWTVSNMAIAAVEGHPVGSPVPQSDSENACEAISDGDVKSRCRAIWRNLDLSNVSPRPDPRTCADRDYRGTLYSLINGDHEPRVFLQCFQEAAYLLLRTPSDQKATPPYGPGLIRAAIADFLFNYKVSQQYAHEFTPYDLSHSADALNNALTPFIDALNRDLTAYQLFVRADMQYRVDRLNSRYDERCCVKRLFGLDKPSFFNDGLITVRTISGQLTYVNTVSQSFLNASSAPQLTSILNSLTSTNSPAATSTPLAGAVFSPNPLARFSALAGALNNYQTTFAQIGRSLAISAIPRSLNTASSAEIAVTLNADESAGGPTYTGAATNGTPSDPAINTSRVASHDTATRVRVDSVKLFEISSFSAIVQRSRSRFPLLPPFVEIPYIGTFAGIPLGSAKEYHSSTAVLSAYVAPTAADIAYGLRFASDLVVDGLNPGPCSFFKGAAGPDVTNACLFRKALSLRDLDKQPISNFNKEMIRCLANNNCQDVSFDSVPKMYLLPN